MDARKLTLLKTRYDHHFSASTIAEFEHVFTYYFPCKEKLQQPLRKSLKQIYRLSDQSKVLQKIIDALFSFISFESNYFLTLMGIEQIRKSYPYFLFRARSKSIYLFDCWENKFEKTEEAIKRHGIQTIFFSAKQPADDFQKKFPEKTCVWLPEAVYIHKYKSLPFDKKTIDVIQIGRKHDEYHEKIAPFCDKNDLKYVFEKVKGKVIFPDEKDFCNALAQSKISICFPSNITHPERSGNVSTMTVRYLQSMASKCLIIGSMPEDMKFLFDYSPIIEADIQDPGRQLKEILEGYSNYLPLIERNYEEVRSKHQWMNRMEIFKKHMSIA